MSSIKYLIILSVAALLTQSSYAQQSYSLSYSIGFPTGNQSEYIDRTSFRGFSFDFIQKVTKNIGVGLETGIQTFYKKEGEKEYKRGTASITGTQYRYTNAFPIIAQAKYLLSPGSGKINFYAGIGLGTVYVNRSTDFGLYRINNTAWQFSVRPEAGVSTEVGPGVKLFAGVKYYANSKADDLEGQSYLTTNFGLIFSQGKW